MPELEADWPSADSSGGQGDRLGGHERRDEPAEDLGGVTVHMVAHVLAARYPHDHDGEARGDGDGQNVTLLAHG